MVPRNGAHAAASPVMYHHTKRVMPQLAVPNVGVRGSPERDISSLHAFGPGGGQIWRVVHVAARAPFVFLEGEILFQKVALCYLLHFVQDGS